MRRLSTLLAGLGLATVAGLATAMPAATSPAPVASVAAAKAEIGKPAPAFTLKDLDGTSHSLGDFKGKIVVIEWFSSRCPWSGMKSKNSVHSSGQIKKLQDGLKKMDENVVYLMIDSSGRIFDTEKALIAADQKATKDLGITSPVLVDYAGTVGKAYGAKTTPHMYVIDGEGVLRYQGALGDRKDRNYVMDAVTAIKKGSTVQPASTRPYGCGVKYKG